MTQLLVQGRAILAVGPFSFTDYDIRSPDAIFPQHVVHNWQIVSADLPEGFTTGRYEWDNGLVSKAAAPAQVLVPASVSRRQARQALLLGGHLDKVQPAIDAIPDDVQRGLAQIYWNDAQDFERHHDMVSFMAGAIGLDDAALDALFVTAATL